MDSTLAVTKQPEFRMWHSPTTSPAAKKKNVRRRLLRRRTLIHPNNPLLNTITTGLLRNVAKLGNSYVALSDERIVGSDSRDDEPMNNIKSWRRREDRPVRQENNGLQLLDCNNDSVSSCCMDNSLDGGDDNSFFFPRHYYDGDEPTGPFSEKQWSIISSFSFSLDDDVDDDNTTGSSSTVDDDTLDRLHHGTILRRKQQKYSISPADNNVVEVTVQGANIVGTNQGGSSSRRKSHNTNLHLKKLRPPGSESAFTNRRQRRRQTVQQEQRKPQQEDDDDSLSLYYPSCSNSSCKILLPDLSHSFDTTDTTDDSSSWSSTSYSAVSDDFNNNASLLSLGRSPAAQLQRLRWSDECGKPLEVVHNIETVVGETCRVIIVLMNAPIAPYEFLHCEFKTTSNLKVGDILKQLPDLRNKNSQYYRAENDNIRYAALCVNGKELINILSIQNYFRMNAIASDEPAVEGDEYTMQDGIVFLAVREGCTDSIKETIDEGEALLNNKLLRREIRKARIAGRALRTLKCSEELRQHEKAAQETAKKQKQKKSNNKNSKKGNKLKEEEMYLDLKAASNDGEGIQSVGAEEECLSPCSAIDDEDFNLYPFGNFVTFNRFEDDCPAVFVEEVAEDNSSNDFGLKARDNLNHSIENDDEIKKFRALSMSDSTDMMDSLLETLQPRQHHPAPEEEQASFSMKFAASAIDDERNDPTTISFSPLFSNDDRNMVAHDDEYGFVEILSEARLQANLPSKHLLADEDAATTDKELKVPIILVTTKTSGYDGCIFLHDDESDDNSDEFLGSYGIRDENDGKNSLKKKCGDSFMAKLSRSDSSDMIDSLIETVQSKRQTIPTEGTLAPSRACIVSL